MTADPMSTRARLSNAGNAPAGSRWRRSVQRVGRPIAVFAIVLQLALLFGHHHFDGFGQRGLAQAFVLLQTGQASPAPDDSRQSRAPVVPAHAACFVCVAIHAAASPDVSVPQLVLPVAYDRDPVPRPTVATVVPPLRAAAFDSRGPPRA